MRGNLDALAMVGRVLLAVMFIYSGFGKITGFERTAGYIASKGLPLPEVLAGIAVAIELLGGIALVIGFKTRLVALAFAVFLIVITPIFHNFWNALPADAMSQQLNFMKNLTILGGMLVLAAFGPGRFSADKG